MYSVCASGKPDWASFLHKCTQPAALSWHAYSPELGLLLLSLADRQAGTDATSGENEAFPLECRETRAPADCFRLSRVQDWSARGGHCLSRLCLRLCRRARRTLILKLMWFSRAAVVSTTPGDRYMCAQSRCCVRASGRELGKKRCVRRSWSGVISQGHRLR